MIEQPLPQPSAVLFATGERALATFSLTVLVFINTASFRKLIAKVSTKDCAYSSPCVKLGLNIAQSYFLLH